MKSLEARTVSNIFESRPVDSAAWLVSLDAIAALHRIVKQTPVVEHADEIAAKRVIGSLGSGDYKTTMRYFRQPEIYPGMTTYAQKLGALSMRGRFDPPLMAALTYRAEKTVKSALDHSGHVFELYENAQDFANYFVSIAEERLLPGAYSSIVDLTLAIKNDTSFWIDKDVSIT